MIDYTIKNKDDGNLVIQSTVKSGSFDHVTEKEIRSFFLNFSKNAYIDTGLLPVDGTGLLAYRQAANHAQIVVQRSPSVSRIIWGKSERDAEAKILFVAQPYQIYIGDILDDNFYGARLFYSPNPITSPNDPLYHVNLPNINCEGYRGNGVGWVCLYHNTASWVGIPLGEKVARLIERCSGDEAYNDANMSETDGPRFYRKMNKPEYLWNPKAWQEKTETEGISWVTDPNLWIPVKVNGIDDQKSHSFSDNAVELTLGMALTGNYAAYYHDSYLPKPVNAIARNFPVFDQKHIFDILQKSYAKSSLSIVESEKLDPYTYVMKVREGHTHNVSSSFQQENEDQNEEESEDNYYCEICTDSFSDNPYSSPDGSVLCEECFNNNYVMLDSGDVISQENAVYIEETDSWFHEDEVHNCDCGQPYHKDGTSIYHWYVKNEDESYCMKCYKDVLNDEDYAFKEIHSCSVCQVSIPMHMPHLINGNVVIVKSHQNLDAPLHMHKGCYQSWSPNGQVWAKYSPCACGNLDPTGEKAFNIYEITNSEALNDMDVHANIFIKTEFFNPCQEVAKHYGIKQDDIPNVYLASACVGCVKCDDNGSVVYDASKYPIDQYPYKNLVSIWKQQKENSN